MESAYATRPCPVCAADAPSSERPIQSAPPAEERSFESLQQLWYGFFPDKAFFSYQRCAACDALYCPKYFSDKQLDVLYGSMPANMAEVEAGSLERTQLGYFQAVPKSLPSGGGLLEIGPDIGLFAEHCVRTGKFERAWMFEPNREVHDELRRRLSPTPVEISTSLTDLSRVLEQSITLAAMIHVLDHLVRPLPFLQELRPKMRADGVLLIVTHNERSALARFLRARWPAYCLQHPHLFHPASMRSILSRAGFQLARTVRSVNYFPLPFLAKQILLAAKINTPQPPLPSVELPLKLGNFITIARAA